MCFVMFVVLVLFWGLVFVNKICLIEIVCGDFCNM